MNLDYKWERESRNEFTLIGADDSTICTITRSYQQRLCSWGGSYECNDTTKPMVWTIMIPGHRTKVLARMEMSVREAKGEAESQVRRLGLIKDSQD